MSRTADDITIEFADDYSPSPEDLEAIHEFRKEVLRHGDAMGVRYKVLKIASAPRSYRNQEIISAGTRYDHAQDTYSFSIPIKDIQDQNAEQIDVEGVIKHEAAHHRIDPTNIIERLSALKDVMYEIIDLRSHLEHRPKDVIRLRKTFGKISAFKKRLATFDSCWTELFAAFERMPDIASASPEKIAFLIEINDLRYLEFKNTLEKLPSVSESLKFRDAVMDATGWYEHKKSLMPGIHTVLAKGVLRSTGLSYQKERLLSYHETLYRFGCRMSKATEYAADASAWFQLTNKNSLTDYFRWNARIEGKESQMPIEEFLQEEDELHPSLEKRLGRIEYMKAYRKTPNEEEFNTFMEQKTANEPTYWQDLIMRNPSAPHQSL